MSQLQAPSDVPDTFFGRLTTHVLDTVKGGPAVGMPVELYAREVSPGGCAEGRWLSLRSVVTNSDGRVDGPLVSGEDFRPG